MKRLAFLLIALTIFATACGGNVFALAVGDCFDDPDSFGEVTDVTMVDCSEPHDNEVYASFDLPGSDYPGDLAVQNEGDSGCLSRFDVYVGIAYEDSTLALSYLSPTTQSWGQGDHEILCFLYDLNGTKLTTSTKGTGI